MTLITAASFLSALALTSPAEPFVPVGEIAPVLLKGLRFPTPVTVDLRGAVLTSLKVQDCVGLHFVGGEWVPAAVKDQVLVVGSDDVTFDGAKLLGDSKAFNFRLVDSSRIAISNSRLDRGVQGINAGRVKGLTILSNFIVGFNNDGILKCNVEDVLTEGNVITASLRTSSKHPDGIQMLSKDGLRNKRVVIRRNIIAGHTQGIFGGETDDLLIEDNDIRCDHGNGIAPSDGCTNVRIRNNRVGTWVGSAKLCNINTGKAEIVERSGNVREAWGRFAALTD